ncbi:MAG: 4Fe-4S dicluster domain-containing protein [Actinomycetota bacterium]|jgi:molybdopterin-containing oxidoreductase family iron-sulfur binding subunit|nr:4Fe-4S dicluster domain-containing protein [Actinomycetota bacterium]
MTEEKLARRRFLHGAALGAAGLAGIGSLGGAFEASTSLASSRDPEPGGAAKPVHQWAMVIDLRYCNGCKLCTAGCQAAHGLHADQTWIEVFTMRNAAGETYHMPRPCMMCEDPPCVQVCPVSANFRTAEGLTLVDQSRCIGTRICMNACPYQARYFNWSAPRPVPRQPFPQEPTWPVPQVEGTVGKCIFCAAMLPSGMLPECVTRCPMGVIYLGDLEADVATNGMGNTVTLSKFLAENDAVKFKESYGTHPRVFYIPGHGQDLESDTAGG